MLFRSSPVRSHCPLFYLHWTMAAGTRGEVPADYPERAAYVATGRVEIAGETYSAGQMILFKPGEAAALKALESSTVMLLGGDPVGPRFIDWNFVSSSRERIEQAKADWRAGRMKLPDGDDAEFVPLPGAAPKT